MATRSLIHGEHGQNIKELAAVVTDLAAAVNELITDHATIVTMLTELNTDGDAVFADLTALRAAFVALTAKMDADFADVTNASTDYAASVDPAALTATAIAAAPPATLTAPAVDDFDFTVSGTDTSTDYVPE